MYTRVYDFMCDSGRFIPERRFREIKSAFRVVDKSKCNEKDVWWPVRSFIQKFNENRRRSIYPSYKCVVDESMCAFRGSGLPHVSFVPRKPEPVGLELKTLADTESGVMLCLEMCEGKEAMSSKKYRPDLGSSVATTRRLVEDSGISGTGRIVCGDSWFASLKTAAELMNDGVYFIGNVKTAHSCFPKQHLQSLVGEGTTRGDHAVMTAKVEDTQFFCTRLE